MKCEYLAHQHHQCAWCGRLIHRDSKRPHGQRFENLAYLTHRGLDRGYSHGACLFCKTRLLAPMIVGHAIAHVAAA